VINSLSIENYRCFKKAHITDLKRINIIVGKNGSGKSALLESLFFSEGLLHLFLRIHAQRLGLEMKVEPTPDGLDSIWKNYFHDFDLSTAIRIETRSKQEKRIVRFFKDATSTETVLGTGNRPFIPLSSEMSINGKKHPQSTLTLNSEGRLTVLNAPKGEGRFSYYPASNKHSPQEAANRFSALSKTGKEVFLIETMKKLYPFITGLSIEIESGEPMIFASTVHSSTKVPVQFISDGIYRIMSILLSFPSCENGVVLIDEIENGLYFETLAEVWTALYRFAIAFNTQVFVTTHSAECLVAAASIAETSENAFSLIRIEPDTLSNGHGPIRIFGSEIFQSAMRQQAEVR
jgi:AAA15 family ATPase/GTPase